jgi:hypothetical protein
MLRTDHSHEQHAEDTCLLHHAPDGRAGPSQAGLEYVDQWARGLLLISGTREGAPMMFIDLTSELVPMLYGLNVALIVSAAAIVGSNAVSAWFRSIRRIETPRLVIHRPVLVR